MRRAGLTLAGLCVLAVSGGAQAEDVVARSAPPMAPFKRGVLVEGSVGTYAPLGALRRISAPGPWLRTSVGWDFNKWFAVFATGDVAFLATGRAAPPPGERGYVVYGFGAGLRVSIPAGERLRFPVRFDLGAHQASDNGVLRTYGFLDAAELGLSYGATAGLEWRALSRHFGLLLEGGVRTDAAFRKSADETTPLAVVASASLHYTL